MPAPLHPSPPDTPPTRLRSLQPDDAVAWSRYLSLPGVTEHTSWGDVSPEALRHLINSYAASPVDRRWALVDADNLLIGTVGLNGIDLQHRRAELAYDLDPRWQGQGLATNAARAVLERICMQREGLLRAYRQVRGQAADFWMYAHIENTASSC